MTLGDKGAIYHEPEAGYVVYTGYTVRFLDIFNDVEATRSEDNAVRDPESTVRGESSGSKGVSNGHFPILRLALKKRARECRQEDDHNLPHASEKLYQSTVPKG